MSYLSVRPEDPASSNGWDALQDSGRPYGEHGNVAPDFTTLLAAAQREVLAVLNGAAGEDSRGAVGHEEVATTPHIALREAIATLVAAATARLATEAASSTDGFAARGVGGGETADPGGLSIAHLAERLLALFAANDINGMKSLLHDAFLSAEEGKARPWRTKDRGAPIEQTSAGLIAAVAARDPLAADAIALVLAEVAAERAAAHQRTAEALGDGPLPGGPAWQRNFARQVAAAYARVAIDSVQNAARCLSEDGGRTAHASVTALFGRLDADTARGLTAALATDLALVSLGRPADHPARHAALQRFALLLGAAVAAKGEASRGVAQGLAEIALKPGGLGTVLEVAETLAVREPTLRMPLAEVLYSLFDDIMSIRSRASVDDKARLADLVLRLASDGVEGGQARNPYGLVRLFSGASDWRRHEFSAFALACEQATSRASRPIRLQLGEALRASVAATLSPTDVLRLDSEKYNYEIVSGCLAALVPANVVLANPTAPRSVAFALTRFHAISRDPFAKPDDQWLRRNSERLAAILAHPDGARLLLPTRNGMDATARNDLLRRVIDDPSITVDTLFRLQPRPAPGRGMSAARLS